MAEVAVALQARPNIPVLGRLAKLLPPSNDTDRTARPAAPVAMSHTFDPNAAKPTGWMASPTGSRSDHIVHISLVTAEDARA
jgi:hypothetical protein